MYSRYSYGINEAVISIVVVQHSSTTMVIIDESTPAIIDLINIFLLIDETEIKRKKITSDTIVFRGD